MEIDYTRAEYMLSGVPRKIATPAGSDMDAEQVGARLRVMREALGLRASEISDQIGMNRAYWSRFENGKRVLTLDMAYKICKAYPVTLDYLFLGRVHSLRADIASKILPLLNE